MQFQDGNIIVGKVPAYESILTTTRNKWVGRRSMMSTTNTYTGQEGG